MSAYKHIPDQTILKKIEHYEYDRGRSWEDNLRNCALNIVGYIKITHFAHPTRWIEFKKTSNGKSYLLVRFNKFYLNGFPKYYVFLQPDPPPFPTMLDKDYPLLHKEISAVLFVIIAFVEKALGYLYDRERYKQSDLFLPLPKDFEIRAVLEEPDLDAFRQYYTENYSEDEVMRTHAMYDTPFKAFPNIYDIYPKDFCDKVLYAKYFPNPTELAEEADNEFFHHPTGFLIGEVPTKNLIFILRRMIIGELQTYIRLFVYDLEKGHACSSYRIGFWREGNFYVGYHLSNIFSVVKTLAERYDFPTMRHHGFEDYPSPRGDPNELLVTEFLPKVIKYINDVSHLRHEDNIYDEEE